MPSITMPARTSKSMTHELWCWSQFFVELAAGRKTFEIRKNDRNFQAGDRLLQKELVPCKKCGGKGFIQDYADYMDRPKCCPHPHGRPTGKKLLFKITYLTDFAQQPGYVVMALKPLKLQERKCSSKKSKPKPSRR